MGLGVGYEAPLSLTCAEFREQATYWDLQKKEYTFRPQKRLCRENSSFLEIGVQK